MPSWSDILTIVICLSYCDLYYFVSSMSGYCEQGIERSCVLTKQDKKLILLKLFDYVVCFGPSNLQNSSWMVEYYQGSDINVDVIWFQVLIWIEVFSSFMNNEININIWILYEMIVLKLHNCLISIRFSKLLRD